MEQRFLIDSNILLEYIGHLLSAQANKFIASAINDEFNISIINRIEILGHPSADETLTAFLDLANNLEISNDIVLQTILLRRVNKIKLPDALIAATAIINNLVLVSRNIKDFNNIKGLQVLNPHDL